MIQLFSICTILLCTFCFNISFAQSGCTDPQANNFDPTATTNNGLCTYNAATLTLTSKRDLPALLDENSGLIFTDGNLWTLNDGGNTATIYKVSEVDGSILQTVTIAGAVNTDWEAITADRDYLYIGDFGNNVNGNRTNLRVYRILKSDIGTAPTASVTADIINFSYQDQVIEDPVVTDQNSTSFDCEAFIVLNNKLHLFTKDWLSLKTKHYVLPALPGNQVAIPTEEFNVNGLITDAAVSFSNPNQIVLVGYSSDFFSLFMWVLYDYNGELLFSGNKRRLNMGSPLTGGQVEGVTFNSNSTGYISGEARSPFFTQRFHSFTTGPFVIVPVELLQFKVKVQATSTQVSWSTTSEQNNAFFVLEHSIDGMNFVELSKIPGRGNSTLIQQYGFNHEQPIIGNNYYRLIQVDIDGVETIYPTKMVTIHEQKQSVKVYPVPVKGSKIIVTSTLPSNEVRAYQIFDITGRLILQGQVNSNKSELDLSILRAGTYWFRLSQEAPVKFVKL